MSDNVLVNRSFEDGWTDIDGETQEPNGWTYYYFDHTTPNPHDSADHAVFRKPELVHKSKNELPEHEHELLILDGDWTLKLFKGSGSFYAGLRQSLFLEPGTYHFSVFIYGDLYKDYQDGQKIWADDAQGRDGLMRFTLNDSDYDNWESVEPGQWNYFDLDFAAEGETTVGIEIMCPFPLRNAGVFMDDWQLVRVEESPPGGRGKPRVQYKRVYNVMPQEATRAQAHEVLDAIFDKKQTLGWSSDDAYVGDLDDRTAVEWFRKEADVPEFEAFYEEYGTGVKVEFENVIKPDVTPPNIGSWLGVHQLVSQPDGMAEMMALKPRIFKAVNRIDQIIAAFRMTPAGADTEYAFRKYHPDEGGVSFRKNPDKPAAAKEWVRISAGDLGPELKAAGVPTDKVYVLSINEVWEYDQALNRHSIEFDLEFIKALDAFNKANGTHFRPIGSSMAVGNPALPGENESQWKEMLPWARALRDAGGAGNYHAYGMIGHLLDLAPYLQDRWMAYFDWLKAHGIILPWFFGEGYAHVQGSVGSMMNANASAYLAAASSTNRYTVPLPGGKFVVLNKRRPLFVEGDYIASSMWLNPGQGWKGILSVDQTVKEMVEIFNAAIEKKNKGEGYEASIGGTPFQGGNSSDWRRFNLAGEPYKRYAAKIKAANALSGALGGD